MNILYNKGVYTRTFPNNMRLQEKFRMPYIYIPQGVPVALFLTDYSNFSGSNTSKPKRTSNAFYVYVPTLACPLSGLPARIDVAKIGKEL